MCPDVPLAGSCSLCSPCPGLLAGLWEFPSLPLAQGLQEEKQREVLADHLRAWTGRPVVAGGLRFIGEVSPEPEACSMSPLCSAAGDIAQGEEGPPFPAVTPPKPCPAPQSPGRLCACEAAEKAVHPLLPAHLRVFSSPRRLSTSSLTSTRHMWSTPCPWMGT